MKKFTILLLIMSVVQTHSLAFVFASPSLKTGEAVSLPTETVFKGLPESAFLALKPQQISSKTGQKVGLKTFVASKIVEKQMNKKGHFPKERRQKDQAVALIICWFFGIIGIHRFYLGYTFIGIIQLLTLGGFGIWFLVDLIRLAFNDLPDSRGRELKSW